MPSISQMITWVLLQVPGWDRDGERGILPIMAEAYNILKRNEAEQNIYVTGGELPTLNTTTSKFQYYFPSNIWRVTKIGFSLPYTGNYGISILDNYALRDNRVMPDEHFHFAGRKYLRFPHVRCYDKTLNANARIEFTVDPRTTSSEYCYIGYVEPTPQLTSETIEPALAEHLHPYLMQATQKLIEGLNHGNYMEAYQYVLEKIKPEVQAEMNLGAQGNSGHVERREF